jgi:hypothetical protein
MRGAANGTRGSHFPVGSTYPEAEDTHSGRTVAE